VRGRLRSDGTVLLAIGGTLAGAPNGDKEITAGGSGHNGDNSAESNKNTPLGNGCFQTTIETQRDSAAAGTGFTSSTITASAGDTILYQLTASNTATPRWPT
jgi:hypothetical protein